MEVVPITCPKEKAETYVAWVNLAISTIIYILAHEGIFERVFFEVGPFFTRAY